MLAYFFITMIVFSIISVFALVTLNNNSNLSPSPIQDNSSQFHAGVIGAAILGAAIGAILGAFATYRFALMIENRREKTQKEKETEIRKRIVSLIEYELKLYSIFLNTHFAGSFETRLSKEDTVANFKTLPRHYIIMTPEIKAKIFDIDVLKDIEKAYQFILLYLVDPDLEITIGKAKAEDSASSIESVIGFIDRALRSISNMKIE